MLGHQPKEEGKIKYKFLISTQQDLENMFVLSSSVCVCVCKHVFVCVWN